MYLQEDNEKKKRKRDLLSEIETEDDSSNEKNEHHVTEHPVTLHGKNAHYRWQEIEESMVHKSLFQIALKNPNKILKMPAGGIKQFSIEDKDGILYSANTKIRRMFRVLSTNHPFYGFCQWIAAAMLIHIEDEKEARAMMDRLHSSSDDFNWKMMYKGKLSLSQMLQRNTKYSLLKVHLQLCGKDRNYIEFLLKESAGKYVCLLQDNNYTETHVVGIDCSSNPK